MNTFHRYVLLSVVALAFMALLSMAVLTAADGPTPLDGTEIGQAAEAAILVQSAQLQAIQAQQRLEELSARYQQLMADLRTKHNAAGCNLTPAQKWSCPPAPKQEAPSGDGTNPSSGNAN